MKQIHKLHRPRGTVGYNKFTPEELRAYNREWERQNRGSRWRDYGDLRECKACKQKKPRTDEFFHRAPSGRLGFNARCKVCVTALRNPWIGNKTAQACGISKVEYDALVKGANCAICLGATQIGLDHCHTTNKPRAALCSPCNTGLGGFKDRPELLLRAIAYLEYFREKHGEN